MKCASKLVLITLLVVAVAPQLFGQNPCTSAGGSVYCNPPQTGVVPFGSVDGTGFDRVNQTTLNVNFGIPVFSRAGRGIDFSYALAYNSWIWYPQYSSTSDKVEWTHVPEWGWSYETQIAGYFTYETTQPGTCGTAPLASKYTNWAYHDPVGTVHKFPQITLWSDSRCGAQSTTNPPPITPDGSGYSMSAIYTATPSPTLSATILSPSGVKFDLQPNSGTVTDSNGNQITFLTSGNTSTYTDTLGTTALTVSGSKPQPIEFNFPNPQGSTSTVRINYVTRTVQTNSGCDSGTYKEFGPTSIDLIGSISTPNGDYVFQYEPTPGFPVNTTGRISSVTLPNGAEYKYEVKDKYIINGTEVQGSNTWCLDGAVYGLKRTTPDGVWQYERNWPGPEMDITSPNSTVTKIGFAGWGNDANFELIRSVWPAGSSNPVSASRTYYNNCKWDAGPPYCVFQFPITDIWRTSETDVQMNSSGNITASLMSRIDTHFNTTGLPVSIKQYDFGQNDKGNLLLETDYDSYYAWDRPLSVTTKDGNGVTRAQTTYHYDGGTLLGSGATQLVPVTTSRGNPDSVSTLVSGGTYLTRHMTYYDTGMVQTVTDVNGAVAQYSNYGCNQAFPGRALSVDTSLSTSMTWNCDGGVLTGQTDDNNGVTTTYNYNDPNYWRPTSVQDPNGNVTIINYTLTSVESAMTFNYGQSVEDILTTFDVMGRTRLVQSRRSPGSSDWDTVETNYDALGRPVRTSLPFASTVGAGNPSAPGVAISFNEASKTVQLTDSGSGIVTSTAIHNDVLQTVSPVPNGDSPGTKGKQSEFDGVGRLKSICEFKASTTLDTDPANCGQRSAGSGYLTTYAYAADSLKNTLSITQNAQAPSNRRQTRVYNFDKAGRLVSEINPETNNLPVTYSYDSDGLCGTYNGDLVKKVDAAGNTTCFTYDKLHRLTLVKALQNGTLVVLRGYQYDSATPPGASLSQTAGRLAYSYTKDSLGNATSEQYYSYSNRGEPVALYQSTNNSGRFYGSYASYYENGALKSIGFGQSYPSLTLILPEISYGLDGEGRPISAAELNGPLPPRTLITSALYDVASRPLTVLYGDGNKDSLTYDQNTGRPTSYSYRNNCQTAKSLNLTWNLNGTLAGLNVVDTAGGTSESCSYAYDELGRVTSDNCGSVWQQTFSYDAFGNIQKMGSQPFSPGYNPQTNRYLGFNYDLNGNLLNDGSHAFTWDSNGLPSSIDSVSLTYDASGRMAEQGRSGEYTQVVYSPTGAKLALIKNGALQKAFVPLPGGSTAVYNNSGFAFYRRPDWLGSSRLATSNPTVISDPSYAPYGEAYGANIGDLSFTGQNQDTVIGLYDFMYREYNPAHGRWMSPDPAGYGSIHLANPQSFNQYSYGGNNPLASIDPSGLDYCYFFGDISCYLGFNGGSGGSGWAGSPGYFSFGWGSLAFSGSFSGFGGMGGANGLGALGWSGGPGPMLQQVDCPRCVVHVIPVPVGGAPANVVQGPEPRVMSARNSTVTRPADCIYYLPATEAALDFTFKLGPAVELGPVSVGLSEMTKTLGEDGIGSEAVLGVKGFLSIQRNRENWMSSVPQGARDSFTILGFNHDLSTPWFTTSGWKFQPAKEFRFGVQALAGVEFSLNTDKYNRQVQRNRACGFPD